MKLSLRWIFDHIEADWKKCEIGTLVARINGTTAEVDGVEKFSLDLCITVLARVISVDPEGIKVECFEWATTLDLSFRSDAKVGMLLFLKKDGTKLEWVTLQEWGVDKDGLLPAFSCDEKDLGGGWRAHIETEDYILEIDNKSLTNRPDLWGHRGFAREIAAMLGLTLKPEEPLLEKIPVVTAEKKFTATASCSLTVAIEAPVLCKRFAALHVADVKNKASVLWMASRLARIGSRPIDCIVDITNYVMFDLSQPMHAFDAQKFPKNIIEPRKATQNETLALLDGTVLSLTTEDVVISNGTEAVALAGVKGGLTSGVSLSTTSLILEAAIFDAAYIRLSAARHKQRTEASTRSEKTLDPQRNILALRRFAFLMRQEMPGFVFQEPIISVGQDVEPLTLKIKQDFIEKRLGVILTEQFILKTLRALDFSVTSSEGEKKEYTIAIPTFRSSKDVTLQEDIVEELGRFYGYSTIPAQLPRLETVPHTNSTLNTQRAIKQYLAFSAGMHEVENYSLVDEDFLKIINWPTQEAVGLANPLSEQRTRLVTSLVPHLLQNVTASMSNCDDLRFFEVARVWHTDKTKKITETKLLSGIFYHKKQADFYQAKEQLNKLALLLELSFEWRKVEAVPAWASQHQTAAIFVDGKKIGTAGKVARRIMARLGVGDCFVFELDFNALCTVSSIKKRCEPLPKYQATHLDLSMMVPVDLTVAQLTTTIRGSDSRIFEVALVDIFQKEEWKDQKSITMRFGIRDLTKNLSKEMIDAVCATVQKAVVAQGAQIR